MLQINFLINNWFIAAALIIIILMICFQFILPTEHLKTDENACDTFQMQMVYLKFRDTVEHQEQQQILKSEVRSSSYFVFWSKKFDMRLLKTQIKFLTDDSLIVAALIIISIIMGCNSRLLFINLPIIFSNYSVKQ